MTPKTKVLLLTLAIALPAFALGQGGPLGGWWMDVWPWAHSHEDPPSNLLPLFVLLGIIEALAFGLAISFAVWGWKPAASLAPAGSRLAWALPLSAFWLLGNWWLHDNLHQVTGFDFEGLAVIEYGFHVTLIAAGCVLCYAFATRLRPAARASA